MIFKAQVLDLLQGKKSQLYNQMDFPPLNLTQASLSCEEETWNCGCLPGSLKTCPSDFEEKNPIFLSLIEDPKLV